MTMLQKVNRLSGLTVRIQTVANGFTQFISSDNETNRLLLGRAENSIVERATIEFEKNKVIVHLYGKNYLSYKF